MWRIVSTRNNPFNPFNVKILVLVIRDIVLQKLVLVDKMLPPCGVCWYCLISISNILYEACRLFHFFNLEECTYSDAAMSWYTWMGSFHISTQSEHFSQTAVNIHGNMITYRNRHYIVCAILYKLLYKLDNIWNITNFGNTSSMFFMKSQICQSA